MIWRLISKRNPRNDFILRPPDTSKMGANTEQFVLSSDSIGEDNNFVSYEEEPDSFNVMEPETEISEKIENSAFGFQNDRSFSDVQDVATQLTEDEAALLPIQLKAVIAGEKVSKY